MDQQIYSNTINHVGRAEVSIAALWRDTVLMGVREADGHEVVKSWLRTGEIIEIDHHRWVMLDLARSQEPDDRTLMVHLLAVEA